VAVALTESTRLKATLFGADSIAVALTESATQSTSPFTPGPPRLSQISAETVYQPLSPAARLSQISRETAYQAPSPHARLSQISREAAYQAPSPRARLSQISLEIIILNKRGGQYVDLAVPPDIYSFVS
jgi:hypothetical protein